MDRTRSRAAAAALAAGDTLVVAASFFGAYALRARLASEKLAAAQPLSAYLPLVAIVVPAWLAAAAIAGVYRARTPDPVPLAPGRVAVATLGMAGAALAGAFALHTLDVSRLFFALFAGLSLSATLGLRAVARASLRRTRRPRKVLVVGTGEAAEEVGAALARHREWGVQLAGYVDAGDEGASALRPVLGALTDLGAILQREVIDEVVFAGPRGHLEALEPAFLTCEELGVGARLVLNFFPHKLARMSFEDLDGLPALRFDTVPTHLGALAVKRAFDVLGSALLVATLSPLFALVALAVKLTSPGPALFRQKRVGLNGREFWFLKFRSMHEGAEERLYEIATRNEMDGPVFKMKDDPRLTRIGALLRKTSVDELPQLWNVLKGEMSLVGPRPPIPGEVLQYKRWQRRRLSMKPGLTCLWQVSGRSEISRFDDWMQLDLRYIDTWSLWLDVKLVLLTIPAVLLGRGAR